MGIANRHARRGRVKFQRKFRRVRLALASRQGSTISLRAAGSSASKMITQISAEASGPVRYQAATLIWVIRRSHVWWNLSFFT